MAGAAAQMDPTIFSRLERLDVMMGLLEEITTRGSGRTLRSSCASTTSSGSDGGGGAGDSSVGSSPKSLEGRCRPLGEVVRETQLKGPLIVRLHQLEERVLKLSLQLEEEKGESERKKGEEEVTSPSAGERPQEQHHLHHHLKGIKSLVKSCVRGHNKASKG